MLFFLLISSSKSLAMIKCISHFCFIGLLNLMCLNLEAQNGKMNFMDPNENFYTTQKRLNKHFKKHEREEQRERKQAQREGKGLVAEWEEQELGGYELYKRWEAYMEPRVYPSGDKSIAFKAVEEYKSYVQQYGQQRQGNNGIQSSTWQPLGPFGDPTGGNAGRINNVRFDPSVANGLWVATPDGGLWSSANNGGSWATNTDFLSPIGCSDVAWDPTNSQNMFLATGDADANDSYSIGVLKSTNGGTTWTTTGMVWTTSQSRRIYKLLANPLNKNVIFAASNVGMYRTTNAGATWNLVGAAGSYTDIEYKPGDTTTVYSVSTQMYGLGTTTFYKSTDGGATWSGAATGLPTSASAFRFAIAVTAANPAYVYLVSCLASNYGFQGFYQSVNSGTSFATKLTSSPNLLGWASNGLDVAAGGQGWYTLSIAASPTNANEVCVGGVNAWRTTNGGTSFSLFAHWTGSGAPFVHADIHDIEYKNGTTIYIGCDGGIFYTSNSGASFASISGTMNIAQLYKMGNSASTYSLAIAGHQDNGTNLFTGGWNRTMGGDGMSAFIDWSNNSVMYGEQYQGSFNRSTNGGASWGGITTGLTGTGAWNTPWHQDPNVANTIYGGRVQMFKSTNQGTSWSQIGTLTGTTTVTEFAVAPSNSSIMYVIQGGTVAGGGNILWKTTNGGTNWTNITGTLPVTSAKMTFVAISNTDPNKAWVTFSGYSAGNKVYQTIDGGTTWTNYSTGLPNLPTNCVTYWNNTNDGLYVGCDIGIYYRDASQASWSLYNTGLPNVSVHDIAIFYPTGKIRAATYGRGMWEADLVNNGTMVPIANFTADKTFICAGMTVNFTDQSSFGPTTWSWTFQSGTPATSTAQNPSVVYNTPGTYSVQLTASNVNGSNSMTKTLYITVSPVNTLPLVEGFQAVTFPPTNWQNYDDKGDGLKWARSATVGKASTASTYYDNYNQDATGSHDEMRAPKYTFAGFSVIKLYFDVAYAQYDPTYSDSLAVVVSSDCGVTWNQVYVKGGTTLATAPNYTAAIFTPTAAQWRTDTVYLNAYAGMPNVLVSFQNRGHYGQAIYLDNINIAGSGAGSAPNASFSVPATKCSGQPITFTDASTGAPTSWSWTFTGGAPATSTAQNPVVTYAAAGTYTATLVSSNGFGSSPVSTQTVIVAATPTVTATASAPTICSGQSTTLTGGGATNYTWMPGGATTSTVSVTPPSTLTYTVTGNTGGCAATKTVSVTVNTTPTIAVNSATICSGNSATLTASGATTYTWNTGPTTNTISVSPASTLVYTVTGTTGTCSSPMTATVTVNLTPTVTATAASPTICSGQSTVLTGSGATNYTWMPGGSTTNTVSVSPGTLTTYTVTGASGTCSATKTVSVNVNPTPIVTATAGSATVCSGQSTTLTAGGATTYTWAPGGVTTSTVSVSPASTTIYTITGVTGGCSATQTVSVGVTITPTVAVNSSTICAGSTATLTASGATTYSWNTGASTSSINVTPASLTIYTVTGTNGGCNVSNTATVTVTSNPTVTVNSSTICSGTTATLTAAGASTYSWNTGATATSINVTPASTTTYTVTGTTGGCNAAVTTTVTVNTTPTVNANSASICSGNPTTLNASGATTYSWSPGTGLSATTGASVTANPGSTTVYTITGTTGSCTSSTTSTVTVVANLTVTVNSAAICAGATVTLTAGGASTYTWSTGSNNTSISVSPGTTTVYTVSGSSGSCNAASTTTVTVNNLPNVSAAAGGTVCAGNPVNLNASGATTYTWNPGGQTGSSVIVSPAITTTYTVIGDDGTCTNTATTVVNVNALPGIVASAVQDTICIGNSTGMSATGGVTYTWGPAIGLSATTGANVTASPTVTTSYTVTGTDINGCTNTAVHTITVNGCTGLINSTGSIQLSVYPNPNHGIFVIDFPAGSKEVYVIEMHNALGQLVYQDKIEADGSKLQKTVTLATEIKGVLTLRISTSSGKLVYRMIIE